MLRAFIFFTCFVCPHFFMCLTCLHFITCLTCLHFFTCLTYLDWKSYYQRVGSIVLIKKKRIANNFFGKHKTLKVKNEDAFTIFFFMKTIRLDFAGKKGSYLMVLLRESVLKSEVKTLENYLRKSSFFSRVTFIHRYFLSIWTTDLPSFF